MGWRKKGRQELVDAPATAADLARAEPPPAPTPPPTPTPAPESPPAEPVALLTEVTADLARSDSGVEFVYRSLERMQQRVDADDLLAILDDGSLGRQAFRAGRRPIETGWARELVRSGAPGIHATPQAVDGPVASSVMQLCSLALRLDVARHESLHDPLTGLLNRRAFDEVLANSCAQSERYGWPFALVLLDLDGFKDVNDRLGHATGDATLQAVGSELRSRLRVGDAAARIGGDEFALVLPNVDGDAVPELIHRLERAVDRAVPAAEMTLSAGFAVAPTDAHRPLDLYRVADSRLYEGKRG